jgi:hypothetical protein
MILEMWQIAERMVHVAQPFKKQVVRYNTPDGRRCAPDSPDAIKRVEESRKYYGLVPQSDGRRKAIPLCPDLGRSKQLLNKLLADAAMRQHGMADPYESHRKRPLADHLADFRAALDAKGNHPRHVRLTLAHLDAVLQGGMGAVWLSDLDAGKASDWLAGLRANRQAVVLPEGREWFRLAEVARMLGIKPCSVTKAVRQQGLGATGNGPARRYPRITVEALAEWAARGVAPETANHYARSLRAFGRWLVRSRRCPSNPFDSLALLNAATDHRHDRRELDADELRLLLSSARTTARGPFAA